MDSITHEINEQKQELTESESESDSSSSNTASEQSDDDSSQNEEHESGSDGDQSEGDTQQNEDALSSKDDHELSTTKKNSGDSWEFENENVAKAWLQRKKKFRPKKKKKSNAQSRLNRIRRAKQKIHAFGSANGDRFKSKRDNQKNKKAKPKFVKFGCSTT